MNTLPFGGGVSLGLAPVNIKNGKSSLWASVRDCNEFLAITFVGAIGTETADITITLTQSKDAAGGTTKALKLKSVWYKIGNADFDAATDKYLEVESITRESPASSLDTASLVTDIKEVVFTVLVRPIDLDPEYNYVRMNVTAVEDKVGAIIYTNIGKAYQGRDIGDVIAVA